MAVNISRIRMIEALKVAKKEIQSGRHEALKREKSEKKRYEEDLKKYHKEMEVLRNSYKSVAPSGAKKISVVVTEYRLSYSVAVRYDLKIGSKVHDITVNIGLDRDEVPLKPDVWHYKFNMTDTSQDRIDIINKNIKLLELSDDDSVSTSTYKSLVNFI